MAVGMWSLLRVLCLVREPGEAPKSYRSGSLSRTSDSLPPPGTATLWGKRKEKEEGAVGQEQTLGILLQPGRG